MIWVMHRFLISLFRSERWLYVVALSFPALSNLNLQAQAYSDSISSVVYKFSMPLIPESSGLIYDHGKVWTMGDSGNPPEIYCLDTLNGAILQTVHIDNYPNTDWEDLAIDSTSIYIGDFGNNKGTRTDLRVLVLNRNDIGNQNFQHCNAQEISFSYNDQEIFTPDESTNFDCESMISKGDSLYLFTKDHGDYKTRVYSLPKVPGAYQLSPLSEFNTGGMVTGADYDASSGKLLLIGYGGGKLNSFVWLLKGFEGDGFFSASSHKELIGNYYTEWQTEGICFSDSVHVFISCESTPDVQSSVYSLDPGQIQASSISEEIPAQLKLWPNPASDFINISAPEIVNSVCLRGLNSDRFLEKQIDSTDFSIDLKSLNLADGIYFLVIRLKTSVYMLKFIKVRPRE